MQSEICHGVKPRTLTSRSLHTSVQRRGLNLSCRAFSSLGFNYSNYSHFPLHCAMKMKIQGLVEGLVVSSHSPLASPTSASLSINASIASGALKSPLKILCTFLL